MNPVYLILFCSFLGASFAFPTLKGKPHYGHYVVTWRDDDTTTHQPGHGLLGEKMCTRGPAYWCHNITQAAECHAMQHCIKRVWENPKEKLPEDNDSVCSVCLDMVKQARDQLLSNETQDELRQVLEGSCNLIPLKLVAKECDELADNFIPELIDALTSRMDPQMVCHVSGLCNSVRIDEMLGEMKELDGPTTVKPLDPNNFDTCPKCEHFVGEYVESLKRLTKVDLRNQLLGVCGYLGSYADSCKAAVTHEMDAIYEYLQHNMKPRDLCGLIGLCQESNLHHVSLTGTNQQGAQTNVRVWTPPREKDDDLECDFCKQLTQSVRNWLVANATEEEFQQVIEGLCKQTGVYKKECLSLAEQYGKQLYETLTEGLNPDEVCKSIGICRSGLVRVQLAKDNAPVWSILKTNSRDDSESSSEEDDLPLMRLVPSEHLAGDDEMKPKDKTKAECEFCEYSLHYIQTYLDDAKTEAEIREKVDKLCDEYLPKQMSGQCKMFVDEYGDALVSLLAQEVDPSEICPKLKLCPATPTTSPAPLTAVGQPVKDILPTCALCTFTIQKIIGLIGKNATKESVDAAMESVCTVVPSSMEKDCMSFMKNYGDQVAEMIVIYGTSHGVCAAIHLCILSPEPPKKLVIESQLPLDRYLPQTITLDRVGQLRNVEDDSKKCVLCEFVITTLDQRLQDNATEEEIKEEVEHICTYLPKTISGRCKGFVDTYGEEIIQYLAQDIDAQDICSRLGLCQPQVQELDAIKHLQLDRCDVCMLVADYLKSTAVENPDADKHMDDLVQKTCILIPKSYQQECNALIEDYGPYLLNILRQEPTQDQGKSCAQIQLCPVPTDLDNEVNTVDEFEY